MALDLGPLAPWNRKVGNLKQRLGYSSLEFLTDLAAAFGPKRVFSSVEWVMKLTSKKKGRHCEQRVQTAKKVNITTLTEHLISACRACPAAMKEVASGARKQKTAKVDEGPFLRSTF
jgi:hypothetical protein